MEQEKVWDAIAGKWAEFRVRPLDEVLEFLSPRDDSGESDNRKGKVLDLGCGSGRHCLDVEGLDFYGVDFSEKLLEFAREKNYVEVKKGFCYDVSYDDGFFDYVVFARVLHCVDSVEMRKKSLEECYRVLKKGGEMLILVWGRGQDRLKNRKKEGFVPWNVDGEKFERYTYIYDFEELKSELVDVGFEIVKSWEDRCLNFVVRKG